MTFISFLMVCNDIYIRVRGLVPWTAYLIPGRGGKWGGRCRDVRFRRRFRRRRFRRFRSRGGSRDPPAGPAGRLAGRPACWQASLPAGRPACQPAEGHEHACRPSISNQIGTNRIPMIKSIDLKGQNPVLTYPRVRISRKYWKKEKNKEKTIFLVNW